MTTEQELQTWAARWLGDRRVPEEFLQLTALQDARSNGGEEISALEAAKSACTDEEKGEKDSRSGCREECADPLSFLRVQIVGPRHSGFLARSVLDDAKNAEVPHFAQVLRYFLPVAETDDNIFVYGYWLHPGENWPPPVICVDDEGCFSRVKGRNIVEALLYRRAGGVEDGDEFSFLAQWFSSLGVAVTARTAADIPDCPIRKDPEDLDAEIFGREIQESSE